MNVVCEQWTTELESWKHRKRVGRPNRVDPKTGLPMQDGLSWKTHNPLCPTCGEMLGTARRRGKYGFTRFPATVNPYKCEKCQADICGECYVLVRTREIIGWHKRQTEGAAKIDVPTLRDMILCQKCNQERVAALPPWEQTDAMITRVLRQHDLA